MYFVWKLVRVIRKYRDFNDSGVTPLRERAPYHGKSLGLRLEFQSQFHHSVMVEELLTNCEPKQLNLKNGLHKTYISEE